MQIGAPDVNPVTLKSAACLGRLNVLKAKRSELITQCLFEPSWARCKQMKPFIGGWRVCGRSAGHGHGVMPTICSCDAPAVCIAFVTDSAHIAYIAYIALIAAFS